MKRAVTALVLCVTVAACSSNGRPSAPATPGSGPVSYREAAGALAVEDGHHLDQGRPYLVPVRTIARKCEHGSPAATIAAVARFANRLDHAGRHVSRLAAALGLAEAAPQRSGQCARTFAAYQAEIVGTGPAKSVSGWGGYAGSVTAWNAVHRADPRRAGRYLPRRGGLDAYQVLSSNQVTSLVERFDPPVSATLALAQITHDLLPGSVRVVYTLHTGQCQQAIYLGSKLGGLLHSSSLGAFVELTSGGGVGHTHYDDLAVDRARITPLGAIGGQPCT